MKLNGEMVALAREFRGLTQSDLARNLTVSQARIAKLEGGLANDVTDDFAEILSQKLGLPPSFFEQPDSRVSFGSSALYYRKKERLTATDRKRIHGLVNVLRIHVRRLLDAVEMDYKRRLPRLNLEDYGGNAALVAQAVRAFWKLPDGPIQDLTGLLESAGVIVVCCDFGTRDMDATSLWLADMPPMVFVNLDLPADRWRFTLAHELAHLVMHEVPNEDMEDQADDFAGELLVPAVELRGQLSRVRQLRLQDLANLKPYWKVAMSALLMRAGKAGCVSKNQQRYLFSQMSQLGYRLHEPQPLPQELPQSHSKLIELHLNELGYSVPELASQLRVFEPDFVRLHPVKSTEKPRPKLRLVR